MIGRAAARLGKEAAEIALQFIADGMDVPDAIRAGAKLMDEPLSPAAEMLAKQNTIDAQAPLLWGMKPYSRRMLKSRQRGSNRKITEDRELGLRSPEDTRMARRLIAPSAESRKVLAGSYAVRELLLDAAQGDPDMAALLAKRLGFEGLT